MNKKVRVRCSCGGGLIASSCPADVADRIAANFRAIHVDRLGHREVEEAEYRRILDRQRADERRKEKARR